MKAVEIKTLIHQHGNITLLELLARLERPHVCPKCKGLGYERVTYDAYPPGLPDSGWATDIQQKKVDCNICDGHGYTARKLKAKVETKIIGYEEE